MSYEERVRLTAKARLKKVMPYPASEWMLERILDAVLGTQEASNDVP